MAARELTITVNIPAGHEHVVADAIRRVYGPGPGVAFCYRCGCKWGDCEHAIAAPPPSEGDDAGAGGGGT